MAIIFFFRRLWPMGPMNQVFCPGWARPWRPLGRGDPWALGPLGLWDPWAQGTLGPWGPWALGTPGPWGPLGLGDPWPLGALGLADPWANGARALGACISARCLGHPSVVDPPGRVSWVSLTYFTVHFSHFHTFSKEISVRWGYLRYFLLH